MKTALKIIIRLLGTVSGIFGAMIMVVNLIALNNRFFEQKDVWILKGIIFSVGIELLGAYLLYVAFVVWRRFSPSAIHHISVFLGFLLFGKLNYFVDKMSTPLTPSFPDWIDAGLVISASVVASYLAFRLCRFALMRVLFPTEKGGLDATANGTPTPPTPSPTIEPLEPRRFL